jgi:hypothetical protein
MVECAHSLPNLGGQRRFVPGIGHAEGFLKILERFVRLPLAARSVHHGANIPFLYAHLGMANRNVCPTIGSPMKTATN